MRGIESARSLCRCESCCRRPPPTALAKGKGKDEVFLACLRGEGFRYTDRLQTDTGAVAGRRGRIEARTADLHHVLEALLLL